MFESIQALNGQPPLLVSSVSAIASFWFLDLSGFARHSKEITCDSKRGRMRTGTRYTKLLGEAVNQIIGSLCCG